VAPGHGARSRGAGRAAVSRVRPGRPTPVARQVTGSARLRVALRAALAAGNAVNAWTPVGIVPGVRVESLARLREFRVRPRAAAQERGRMPR